MSADTSYKIPFPLKKYKRGKERDAGLAGIKTQKGSR